MPGVLPHMGEVLKGVLAHLLFAEVARFTGDFYFPGDTRTVRSNCLIETIRHQAKKSRGFDYKI